MKAVILAGGRGTRLAPYTTVLPKPLMPLGEMPILEIVLRQLASHGFTDVTLAVGYLAELLMAYCGDGGKFGVRLRYSREEEPLGTAGPLSLIGDLDDTFLVMNGDILCNLDYSAMVQAHRRSGAAATVATFMRDVRIDLGVIETDGQGCVSNYIEKPTYRYAVSTGIYLLQPEVLELIPAGHKYDLPDLVLELLRRGRRVNTFPFDGFWLDIGRHDDYERAIQEFSADSSRFLRREGQPAA